MAVLRTRSLSAPPAPDGGRRVLITRYRPRGARKGAEPWDAWDRRLAPSAALLDALRGRRREGRRVVARDLPPISWDTFRARFMEEMQAPAAREALSALRAALAADEAVTVLCHCADETRCHRSIVASLMQTPAR